MASGGWRRPLHRVFVSHQADGERKSIDEHWGLESKLFWNRVKKTDDFGTRQNRNSKKNAPNKMEEMADLLPWPSSGPNFCPFVLFSYNCIFGASFFFSTSVMVFSPKAKGGDVNLTTSGRLSDRANSLVKSME